jgi:hypothetical protein
MAPRRRRPHRGLTKSLPTSACGTTPMAYSHGLPWPTDAPPRLGLAPASPPTRRPSSPSFGTPQSEPPTLRDIAAPNPAIRSRACLASVSLGRGFVPLSRRKQAGIVETSRGCGAVPDEVVTPTSMTLPLPIADTGPCGARIKPPRAPCPPQPRTCETRTAAVRARVSDAHGFDRVQSAR